jgi:hypothetical protein
MSSGLTILLVVTGIVLVLGTVAALVWWALADAMFPGTSRKTGQAIFRRKGKAPPRDAVVVRFDEPPAPGPTPPASPRAGG